MRAYKDESAGAHAVQVSCLACGRRIWLHQALIDIDGPAFMAYYCAPCFPWGDAPHVLAGKGEFGGRQVWYDIPQSREGS